MWYSTRPGNTKHSLCQKGLPSGSPFCRCCLGYGQLGSKPDIKPVFRSQGERRHAVKTSMLARWRRPCRQRSAFRPDSIPLYSQQVTGTEPKKTPPRRWGPRVSFERLLLAQTVITNFTIGSGLLQQCLIHHRGSTLCELILQHSFHG